MNNCDYCSLRNAADQTCEVFICPVDMPSGEDRENWEARQREILIPATRIDAPTWHYLTNDQHSGEGYEKSSKP